MKKGILFLLLMSFICSEPAFAGDRNGKDSPAEKIQQEKNEKNEKKEKKESKWSGKPVVTLFANFHSSLEKGAPDNGFGLERAYIGYKASYNDEVFAAAIIDAGISETFKDVDFRKYRPYLKNAYVQWKRKWFDISFGLVTTQNFTVQDKFFNFRYVMRPYADLYGGTPSADLGIVAKFRATDWMKWDVSITNGEGYKKIKYDGTYRFGTGVTFEPLKSLQMRLYYEYYMKKPSNPELLDEHELAAFIGYRHQHFLVGGEFQYYTSQRFSDVNKIGFSLFARADIVKNLDVFARYDMMFSDYSKSYCQRGDVMSIRGGLEYAPFKCLKIAPNVSYENMELKSGDIQKKLYFFLNVLFTL